MSRLISTIMVLTTSLLTFARQNPAPEKTPEQTLSVNVDLVNVLFTTTDKKGKLIPDLKREDFKVYEDGKLKPITNLSAETNLPLTIPFFVDTSGSLRDMLLF